MHFAGAGSFLGRVAGEAALHLLHGTRHLVTEGGLAAVMCCWCARGWNALGARSSGGAGSGVGFACASTAGQSGHEARLGCGGGGAGGARTFSCAEHFGGCGLVLVDGLGLRYESGVLLEFQSVEMFL